MTGVGYWAYYRKLGHIKQNYIKVKKKETWYNHYQSGKNDNNKRDREIYDSQDVVSATTSKNEKFTNDIWIYDGGAIGNSFNSLKVQLNLKRLKRSSLLVAASVWWKLRFEAWNAWLFKFMTQDWTPSWK
jgi:hypothetical protein